MWPTPACLARQAAAKSSKSSVYIFSRPKTTPLEPSMPRILPRESVPTAQKGQIHPAPIPRNHEIKQATLIEALIEKKRVSADWPANLRIEPFVSRKQWAPVKQGLRSKLKSMLREA